MIFVALAALLITLWRYTSAVRRAGSAAPLWEIPIAMLAGLAGGLVLGLAARGGMAVITIANGGPPRFSWLGTLQVVATFAGLGALLGIAYAGLFRQALGRSGLAFGVILMIASAYPLARSGAQVLAAPVPGRTLLAVAALVLAAMWLPYALVLERVTAALQRCRSANHAAS